ncbi:coenzyme F420-reducing hydrogenase delta subunit [Marinisporobacter balticus]|uniref:Coenzyme F420-reducing hydrogenase delta subunit n=2 Tax=Marinisporobacter balticus TaxID=2018667 RepID=A0A4R2KJ36_9FIRM|nr:hydrogenase iron-sulfur subunit [Marinisporobacter balticus]TCO70018.1 coenzyme F420-reducing hydrogenase delta subunit [Marinisporobacter balticus]
MSVEAKETVMGNKNEFEPLIVAFCCNWCSYAGADLAGTSRLSYPANVKIIRVPCSCRVNANFVLRAFQRGADGVVIAGCHPGDCHYSTGNYYTRRRFSLLTNFLEYVGIEQERFKVDWISAAEGNKFATVMNDVLEKVHRLGPNRKLRDARWKR